MNLAHVGNHRSFEAREFDCEMLDRCGTEGSQKQANHGRELIPTNCYLVGREMGAIVKDLEACQVHRHSKEVEASTEEDERQKFSI